MLVSQAMKRRVATASAEQTIADAAATMKRHDVGCLPVVDGSGRIAGVVTDRDLVLRALAGGAMDAAAPVAGVMTPGAVTCRADDDLRAAMRLMRLHRVRRLPVVREDGAVVGIIALRDIAWNSRDEDEVGDLYATVSELEAEPERESARPSERIEAVAPPPPRHRSH